MKSAVFLGLCLSLGTMPTASASIRIRAWIDGRSQLILDDATARWQHFDFAAPGRLDCNTGAEIQATYLESVAWWPEWADLPDCENRFCGGCFSSLFEGLQEPLPNKPYTPTLKLIESRGTALIVEYPSEANGYRVVIEFDDNPWNAAAWYEVDLEVFGNGCSASNYCLSTPNSSGQAAKIHVGGSLSVADNSMLLRVSAGPAHQPGLFFYGSEPAGLPFVNGYLCVSPFSPGLIRIAPAVQLDGLGEVERWVDMQQLPPSGQITGGSTWYSSSGFAILSQAVAALTLRMVCR